MLVALFVDKWTLKTKDTKPSIARITRVNDSTVDIEYLRGGWKTKWDPWILDKEGTIWADKDIPKASIVFFNFELKDGKLSKGNRAEIKRRYHALR